MSAPNWIWLGVVLLLLTWNYRLWRKLGVCRNRLYQHFLTWKLAAFGVTDWEAKDQLDKAYGVDCYKDAYREIAKAAAEGFQDGNGREGLSIEEVKFRQGLACIEGWTIPTEHGTR